jgi:adenylate cyclase
LQTQSASSLYSHSTNVFNENLLDQKSIISKSSNIESNDQFKNEFFILIVDDSIENCQILEKFIRSIGYNNITTVQRATQALAMIENGKFDLILLDIDMPEINGVELLKNIRPYVFQHKLIVIMITGFDTLETAIHCIKLGAEDILLKPFNKDLLHVRIKACLEKKWFFNKEKEYREILELEKNRYVKLLYAIFPPSIAHMLTAGHKIKTRTYPNVAVLFVDIVNFTNYCSTHSVDEITKNLQSYAEICETSAAKYNIQKIKTVGDGFMAIAGMLTNHKNQVIDCIKCAEEIRINTLKLKNKWEIRAGIDYGAVIGGIIGHRQYLFDIWSDTVNTASRIHDFAEIGTIAMSKASWEQIQDICYGKTLGMHAVKGKTAMEIFQYQNMINPEPDEKLSNN